MPVHARSKNGAGSPGTFGKELLSGSRNRPIGERVERTAGLCNRLLAVPELPVAGKVMSDAGGRIFPLGVGL